MDSEHIVIKESCPKCGCLSATACYEKGTCVCQMLICDGCGEDLR